jgi:hypothetical protein
MRIEPKLNPTQKLAIEKLHTQFIDSYQTENKQLKSVLKKLKKRKAFSSYIILGFICIAFYMDHIINMQQQQILHLNSIFQNSKPNENESEINNYYIRPEEKMSFENIIYYKAKNKTLHSVR